jgi:hypothetical protein
MTTNLTWTALAVCVALLGAGAARAQHKPAAIIPSKPPVGTGGAAQRQHWKERSPRPGEKRDLGFGYGPGGVVSTGGGSLGLNVGGSLEMGGVLTVTAYVKDPVRGQALALVLPAGLQYVQGSQVQIVPPARGRDATSMVTWTIRGTRQGQHTLRVQSNTGIAQERAVTLTGPRTVRGPASPSGKRVPRETGGTGTKGRPEPAGRILRQPTASNNVPAGRASGPSDWPGGDSSPAQGGDRRKGAAPALKGPRGDMNPPRQMPGTNDPAPPQAQRPAGEMDREPSQPGMDDPVAPHAPAQDANEGPDAPAEDGNHGPAQGAAEEAPVPPAERPPAMALAEDADDGEPAEPGSEPTPADTEPAHASDPHAPRSPSGSAGQASSPTAVERPAATPLAEAASEKAVADGATPWLLLLLAGMVGALVCIGLFWFLAGPSRPEEPRQTPALKAAPALLPLARAMVRHRCEGCGKGLKIPQTLVGKKCKCPCGPRVRIAPHQRTDS